MDFWCLPTSRAEARRLGLTRYDNGKPCPRGHLSSVRLVRTGGCHYCAKEAGKKQAAIWIKTNPDKKRAHGRKAVARYREKNPHLTTLRRALVRGAKGTFTGQDIADLFSKQRGFCICGKALRNGYQIDHKIPVSRGGSNFPDNLQLLCPHCNASKGAKTMEEWKPTLTQTLPVCLSSSSAAAPTQGFKGMNDVINRSKYSYQRIKTLDADGKVKNSSSNGDAVARAMLTLTADQIQDLAEANDVDLGKYKNQGLARMALANRVRALVRKGTAVQIGDHLVKKLDQKVKVDEPRPAKPTEKKAKRGKKVSEPEEEAA